MSPATAGKTPRGAATAAKAAVALLRRGRPRYRTLLVAAALVLALVGVGMASYLAFQNIQGKASSICVGTHGCSAVQQSQYGKVLGVPVSVPGLLLYLALAAAAVAWLRDWRGLRDQVAVLGFYAAAFGVLFSGFLTYLEGWVIDAWCAWCLTSASLLTLLLIMWLPVFVLTAREHR